MFTSWRCRPTSALGAVFHTFKTTGFRNASSRHSDEYIRRFIEENTEVVGGQSLTPEIRLRLFTPNCRFWKERPELWPFSDPYWAIYWPGGKLSRGRYLLDNPQECRGKAVLDLGSGCGASSIVAKACGAEYVTANDIDAVAGLVTTMNSELNYQEPPVCLADDLINTDPKSFDLMLLGDMFYDETLATSLHAWLDLCIKTHGTKVLIGDPGRAAFEAHTIHRHLQHLAQYELPESVQKENYGLTYSSVWRYCPKL
uniref:Electron transfer flavoprotein beta subunit lysine methyltransferase n=1 Tax=Neogobius melanostomus TaxID=47308 RepID=A0A8C6UML4_9GOBI